MSLPEYEYKGLMAEAWDILRGDTSNWTDRFFYLQFIEQTGQPVLDVGCGTGRLLLDYLSQGIDIDGTDNSPDMLAICRQKAESKGLRLNLYEQHLESLSPPRQYKTILVPSSTIQLITESRMATQALRNLYNHLLPDGALVASIMTLWKPGEPLFSEWEKTAVSEDGVTFRRVSRSWYSPETECESTEDLYQQILDNQVSREEVHRRSPATRSYSQDQARKLFEDAGFDPVELRSEFTFESAKATDTLFTVIARKKQAEP